MTRSTSMRLAVLVLTAGLIAVLPASAVAAKPRAKAKTTLVEVPFLLPEDADVDRQDAAAVCPSKTTLLSGGALANTAAPVPVPELDVEIFRSGPVGDAWYVRYENDTNVNLSPSAQAICIKDKLKVTGLGGGAGKSSATAAAAPKALSKVTQVNTPFTLPPSNDPATNGQAQFDVACPKGTTIAGGGASFSSADVNIQLEESGPQGNGWHVRYDNGEDSTQPAVASALCLKNKLKVEDENDKARSKFEQVDQTVTLPASTAATNNGRARFNVDCPKGTTIVGGGGKIDPAAPLADTDFELEESGVVGNGWQVTFDNGEAVAQTASVHALCLKDKLKVK